MKKGYYWVRIKKLDRNTIGYYDYDGSEKYGEELYSDGSGTRGYVFCWQIMGTDEMFVSKDVEVIEEVDHP